MKTYLFAWNPNRWTWDTLDRDIEQVDLNGRCSIRWSCGNTKSIKPGDRIFLIKIGTTPKGIIGAGFATTSPYSDIHWDIQRREALYIAADFETLLNPDKDPILTLDILNVGRLSKQNWTPQASGISIRLELVDELEAIWFDFIKSSKLRNNPFVPTDDDTEKTYSEGTPNQVALTKYERNPFARKTCLEFYGYTCTVCTFNFQDKYGAVGKDFIHVHHLTQISKARKKGDINPINDLRPVCPNCHAMIHRRKEGYSIVEVKLFIKMNDFVAKT